MRELMIEDIRGMIDSGEMRDTGELQFEGITHIGGDAAKYIFEEGCGGLFFTCIPQLTISDEAAHWLIKCENLSACDFHPSEKLVISVEAAQIFADDIIRLCKDYGKDFGNDFYTFENCSKEVFEILRATGISKENLTLAHE